MEAPTLSPAVARVMIRSLTRGTAIAEGVRFLHVGHERWIAAQRELLGELADDGYSETKFVRGAYGAGKTHFLLVIQDIARAEKWVTSHVECKVDGVQIDRFETLYPRIIEKIHLPTDTMETGTRDHAYGLLDEWVRRVAANAGVPLDGIARPLDAENRVYGYLEDKLIATNLPTTFVQAVLTFARCRMVGDYDTARTIVNWFKGEAITGRVPATYLTKPNLAAARAKTPTGVALRSIGAGTAVDALRGLLWLVREAGFTGLVLCIDEVEELVRLGSKRRQDQALQALREHVDHAGGDSGHKNLCLYLSATPAMFDSPDYFPRYDALQTRIHPLGAEINWRGPVIDLERAGLAENDMQVMAKRIWGIHRVAYGDVACARIDEETLGHFVAQVMATRFRAAKPRLLARLVVDELERARQAIEYGEEYRAPSDVADRLLSLAAESGEGPNE